MKRLITAVVLALLPGLSWGQVSLGQPGISYYKSGLGSAGSCTATACTFTVPILLPDGTLAAPGLAFANQSSVGIYRSATNQTTFSQANSDLMTLLVSTVRITAGAFFGFSSGSSASSAIDTMLTRDAAANFQLGTDAATATAQTISAADSTGAGNAGASLTLSGGSGGAGGATGAVVIGGPSLQGQSAKALTDNSATAFVRIAIPQTIVSNYRGGEVVYQIYCDDDTNQASQAGTVKFTCHNIAGTEACGFGTPDGVTLGDGTATLAAPTFDATSGAADTIDLRVTSDCQGVVPNTHTFTYLMIMPLIANLIPQ